MGMGLALASTPTCLSPLMVLRPAPVTACEWFQKVLTVLFRCFKPPIYPCFCVYVLIVPVRSFLCGYSPFLHFGFPTWICLCVRVCCETGVGVCWMVAFSPFLSLLNPQSFSMLWLTRRIILYSRLVRCDLQAFCFFFFPSVHYYWLLVWLLNLLLPRHGIHNSCLYAKRPFAAHPTSILAYLISCIPYVLPPLNTASSISSSVPMLGVSGINGTWKLPLILPSVSISWLLYDNYHGSLLSSFPPFSRLVSKQTSPYLKFWKVYLSNWQETLRLE